MKLTALHKPIYVVGVKNTGKSRVARHLARQLDRAPLDTDNLLEDLFRDESGERKTVREIYRLDDGETFRRLEAAACREAASRMPPPVVATGGGICDNPPAVENLRAGLVVGLEADAELLFRRIMSAGIPSFMTAKNREEAWVEFRTLHRRRQTLYREMSHVIVDVTDRNEDEITAEVLIRLEELMNGGK